MNQALAKVFPAGDYQFQLRFERGPPEEFFAPTGQHAALLAERRRWLRRAPESCAALLPAGRPLLGETIGLAQSWSGSAAPALGAPDFDPARGQLAEPTGTETGAAAAWASLLNLGEFWEPDFLLLRTDPDGEIRLQGGCVCFPSAWSLREKIGRPIEFIHDVVPGLNARLGPAIHQFLAKLKPGVAWLRGNWGLTRSPELNQHPDRGLPRLDGCVPANEVWLRVEHQALLALPQTGGILFGIRLEVRSLADVKEDMELAGRLARGLQTLPEALAVYKGIATARERLLEILAS